MIYGAIIDKTCTQWQMECGEQANCMLYDLDAMRKYLMLTTAFIMGIGVIFDGAVWYYSKDVILFSEEPEKEEKKNENGQTKASNEYAVQ